MSRPERDVPFVDERCVVPWLCCLDPFCCLEEEPFDSFTLLFVSRPFSALLTCFCRPMFYSTLGRLNMGAKVEVD